MLGVCHSQIKRAARKLSSISLRDPALRLVPVILKTFVYKSTEFIVTLGFD
jgi:hypothetical protein